jgi:hypothetical protein
VAGVWGGEWGPGWGGGWGPPGELGGARPGEALVGDGAAPGAGFGPDRGSLSRQDFTEGDASFDVWSPARGVHAGFWSIAAGDRKARPLNPRWTAATASSGGYTSFRELDS